MLLDRLIEGHNYQPADFAPGRYYWRVAPAQHERGTFLRPGTFYVRPVVKPAPSAAATKPIPAAKRQTGWVAAIGTVDQLFLTQQSAGAADLIAVNSESTVYALDSARGVARWVSRFAPVPSQSGGRSFKPLLVKTSAGELVVFAFNRGIRAVDARSGRQVWSAAIPAAVSSAVVGDGSGENSAVYLVNQKELLVLEAATGTIRKQVKLERQPVNAAILLPGKGLLIPVKDRAVELLSFEGEHVRFIDVGSEVTTPPLVVNSARGVLLMVGTKNGIAAFDAKSFRPLGQLALGVSDYPVGSILAADLVGDSNLEIVVTTNRGRLLAIDATLEKTFWARDNPGGLASPAIADVNGDGRVELILPGSNRFAIALSGVDGATIWESDEPPATTARPAQANLLLAVRTGNGRLLIVGSDPSGAGLRAMEINHDLAGQSPR